MLMTSLKIHSDHADWISYAKKVTFFASQCAPIAAVLILLVSTIGLLGSAETAHADDKGISLLIWFAESPRIPGLPSNSLSRRKYEMAVKRYGELTSGKLKSVFIPDGKSGTYKEKLSQVLAPEDKISNLIFAIHGSTNLEYNSSILYGLGEFDEEGSHDDLKELLAYLGPKFDSQLHIYLDACSTACGTQAQFENRVMALGRELRPWGVSRLSVWGSQKDLAFDPRYRPLTQKRIFQRVGGYTVIYSAWIGAIGSAGMYIQNAQADFDPETLRLALSFGSVIAASGVGLFIPLMTYVGLKTGVAGRLTVVENDSAKTINVTAGTIKSVFPMECEAAFLD